MDSIIEQIFKLKYKCVSTEETFFEKAEISQADYHVIDKLEIDECLTATEFAVRLDVSVSRGSRIITRMLKNGYLNSSPADGDRRKLMLSLSKKGKDTKLKITSMKNECNRKIQTKLSEQQMDTLQKNLEIVMKAL